MGRLTSYENGLYREMVCRHEDCHTSEEHCPYINESECRCLQEILDKLAHYEDLEEQGRLIDQKHGHWIYKHDEEGNTGNAQYECSECGAGDLHAKSQEVPYCWKCGAKMDEVE